MSVNSTGSPDRLSESENSGALFKVFADAGVAKSAIEHSRMTVVVLVETIFTDVLFCVAPDAAMQRRAPNRQRAWRYDDQNEAADNSPRLRMKLCARGD
jgi:hypothetical protein